MDSWTQGVGWVCVLLLVVAWYREGRLRWAVFRLFFVFLAFVTVISLVWSTGQSSPMNYAAALGASESITGGRYLYPVLMAWFAGSSILLLRELPGEIADSTREEFRGHSDQPTAKRMT